MAFSGMAGNGRLRHRLGREGSSLLRVAPPRRGQDGQNGMAFIWNRYAVAAGPRLRSFVLRTSVLQKRGVCSCWEFQGASRNGGAFLTCSEGQDYQQLSELWFRQSVCWRQLTAAAQAASSLTRIRRVAVRFWRQATCICHPSCGSILATGNLHLSPRLEQFFNRRGQPKPAAGERPAIAGARSPEGPNLGVHFQTPDFRRTARKDCRYPHNSIIDQPRVHLHGLLQLLDCDLVLTRRPCGPGRCCRGRAPARPYSSDSTRLRCRKGR